MTFTIKNTIRKNSERYPGIAPEWPEEFEVAKLTMKQADELAYRLSNFYPGCDYAFYVVGGAGDDKTQYSEPEDLLLLCKCGHPIGCHSDAGCMVEMDCRMHFCPCRNSMERVDYSEELTDMWSRAEQAKTMSDSPHKRKPKEETK